jgi:GDPmannose 4,6-dehydratase
VKSQGRATREAPAQAELGKSKNDRSENERQLQYSITAILPIVTMSRRLIHAIVLPNFMKKAVITGISGQDGAYLAKLLLEQGYSVCGTSRDAQISPFTNLQRLGIREQVQLESVALNDFRSVIQVLFKVQPDEIYHLAGQSSVSLSFQQPVETQESVYVATLNLLEAIRFTGKKIRLYNASSSECFGDTNGVAADEETPFRPSSPYAVAKSAAFWQVANYREAYGLYACSGILFNHESPLRPERFVTKKIVAAACRIAAGKQLKITLGTSIFSATGDGRPSMSKPCT